MGQIGFYTTFFKFLDEYSCIFIDFKGAWAKQLLNVLGGGLVMTEYQHELFHRYRWVNF